MAEGTLNKRKWELMWTNDNSSAQTNFTVNVDMRPFSEAYILFRRNTTDFVNHLFSCFIIVIPGNSYRYELLNLIVGSGYMRYDFRMFTINLDGTITFSNAYYRTDNSTSAEIADSTRLIPYRIYAR